MYFILYPQEEKNNFSSKSSVMKKYSLIILANNVSIMTFENIWLSRLDCNILESDLTFQVLVNKSGYLVKNSFNTKLFFFLVKGDWEFEKQIIKKYLNLMYTYCIIFLFLSSNVTSTLISLWIFHIFFSL